MKNNIFTISLIGILGVTFNLITETKAEAVIFGVKSRFINSSSQANNSYPGGAPSNLFSFNEDGTGFINYGQLTFNGGGTSVDGLAISVTDGLFGFAVNTSGSTLISITPGQSAVTAIGSQLNGRIIKGATFQGNLLWAIDSQNNELVKINHNTGTVIEAKQLILNGLPYDISGFHDIAVAPDNSVWLADSCSGIRSFNINTAEVSSSQILPCSAAGINNAFDGLAFSDNIGEDIAFVAEGNYSDDIRRINLTTSTQTALFNNIYSGYNGGPMDLASVVKPVPEPLTILGAGTAVAFGTAFKRKLSKAKKK